MLDALRQHLATIAIFATTAISLAACTTYVGNFQDPSTLSDGEVRYGFGGTGLLPLNLTVWGHFGVADDLEIQARVELPAGAELGLKWGVIGDRTASGLLLALSASIGGHFVITQDTFGGDSSPTTTEGGTTYHEAHRPSAGLVPVDATLQLGYRFGRDLVLYVAPRYSYRAVATADVERHGWGITVGASGGPKKERLFVELGLHENPFPPAYARDFYQKYFTTIAIGMEWE